MGQKNLITISRSELKADNPLDSAFDHCSTAYIRPDYKRTFVDPERTAKLKEGLSVNHSQPVENLDVLMKYYLECFMEKTIKLIRIS